MTPKTKRKIDDDAVIERLTTLATRQKELSAISKESEKDRKIVDEEIKELLREFETKGHTDDNVSISLSWIGGKKSLDTPSLAAALEEHGLSIEDFQREGNGYERLMVKLK